MLPRKCRALRFSQHIPLIEDAIADVFSDPKLKCMYGWREDLQGTAVNWIRRMIDPGV
jgi:hypothetical protein